MESLEQLSRAEFLYQQSQYIRKRWWILQGGLLVLLWILLAVSESGVVVQKSMGVAAPLFAVLLLPELWKNRNAQATEIEGTAFYSLRQIYAARIFLFAMADFLLLFAFFAATVLLHLLRHTVQPENVFRDICASGLLRLVHPLDPGSGK